MKRIGILFLVLVIVLSMTVIIANAETANNIWVYDESDYLLDSTEQYVKEINEKQQAANRNNNLAIVMVDEIPLEEIQNYASSLFLEYNMSKSEDSYDVLIMLSINNRKCHIERGLGYDINSLIYQDLHFAVVDEENQMLLMAEEYDDVVLNIANSFETIMDDLESDEYAIREERVSRNTLIYKIIFGVGCAVAFIAIVVTYVIKERKREVNQETEKNADKKPIE